MRKNTQFIAVTIIFVIVFYTLGSIFNNKLNTSTIYINNLSYNITINGNQEEFIKVNKNSILSF